MSNGLNSMDSIFQAFQEPIPIESEDGACTAPELTRFLNKHAPGYALESDISSAGYITVRITLTGTGNAEDEVGFVGREAVAFIEDANVWEAFQTAFIRACAMWGLVGQKGKPADVDQLLADLNLP